MAALILMGTGHLIGAQNTDNLTLKERVLRSIAERDSVNVLPLCLLSVRVLVSHWCPEQQ